MAVAGAATQGPPQRRGSVGGEGAADQLGGSQWDATNQVRTADQIAELPETAGAFAEGDITRESASAIGRVLRDARLRKIEDAERRLLEAGREGGPDQPAAPPTP